MKIQNLSALILSAVSMQAVADKEYWVGSDGEYARDRNGHCVRTIKWTPEAAIPGCEGGEAKAAAEEKAPAAAKSEPVKSTPATEAAGMAVISDTEDEENEYVTLSLASSATFELGGSTLSDEGKAAVADLVSQFKGREVNSVVIEGHTDDTGDAAFNQDLSEKRAEAVKAEAVANGANADKITTVGYGESRPIADNSTREGRAKNRRVEIKIDEKK
jgi:OmpA-OmpF porin, OOP family